MQTEKKNNTNIRLSDRLLGEPTQAKASGVAFSAATVFPSVLLFVLLAVFGALGLTKDADYSSTDWYRYTAFLLPQVCFAIIAIWYFSYLRRPVKATLCKQKCHPKYFLWAILLQIGLFSLTELNTLFLQFLEKFGYQADAIVLPSTENFGVVGVLIVVALLPAVFEEIFFRGIMLNGLKSFGVVGSILLSGGLFALFHQNPPQTVYQFCCGAAFALVAVRSGSILPSMLSHLFNNALIIVLYANKIETLPAPVYIPYIIIAAICLITSLVYLIFIDKNTPDFSKTAQKDMQSVQGERKRFFLFAAVGLVLCLLTWTLSLFV